MADELSRADARQQMAVGDEAVIQAVLHTDDPDRDGNVPVDVYFADMQALADEVGDEGLHTVPQDELDAAAARLRGGGDL